MMNYVYGAVALIVLAGGIYLNNLLDDSRELERVQTTKHDTKQFHESEANASKRVIEVYKQQADVEDKVEKEIDNAEQASTDDDSYTILASGSGVRSEADYNKTTTVQGVREVPPTTQGGYKSPQVVLYIINAGETPVRDTSGHQEASEKDRAYESNYKRIREQYR